MVKFIKEWLRNSRERRGKIEQFKKDNPRLTIPYYCPFSGSRLEWDYYITSPTKFDTKTGKPLNGGNVGVRKLTDINGDACFWNFCVHRYNPTTKEILTTYLLDNDE